MRYIINERQYKLLTEQEEILKVNFSVFDNNWEILQKFLERRGNPPYMITDDLDLSESDVKSLGNLTSVGGWLDLNNTDIKSLGNLTSVGGTFNWGHCNIKSLDNLTSVGGDFVLYHSKIEDLGNLTSVGGNVYLSSTNIDDLGKLKYVGGNLDLRFTPLSRIYVEEEIRKMIGIKGDVYL